MSSQSAILSANVPETMIASVDTSRRDKAPSVNLSPHLAHPPINEVVCGFEFEPTKLTTLDFGVYWERRRADFPRHELHPPILEAPAIHLGPVVDARVWLISGDEEVLIQLQSDRFYVNWRRKGDSYPRFSDHGGNLGLKRRAIEEFEAFADFAQERTSQSLRLTGLELTKIDILRRGSAYDSMEDLEALLPITKVFEQVSSSDPQQLQLRMVESSEPPITYITVVMDKKRVRIETKYKFNFSGDLDKDFVDANERVNKVFFGLLNTSRFAGEG